jgi:hypothetical protein
VDTVRRFAYGTDASFYRLVPKIVVKVRVATVPANKQARPAPPRAAFLD